MKIQCACGAKYAFEVTPEQAQQPVQFVCPACGLDASAYVTQLIREQFGLAAPAPETAAAPAPEIAPAPGALATTPGVEAPPSAAPPPPAPVQVRVRSNEPRAAAGHEPVADERFCRKHPGVRPTDRCVVCGKPICPRCMEILGYVCSPLCRQKAELSGIEVPVYAAQKSVVERRRWRKIGLLAGSVCAVLVILLGVWIWYEWFLSRPSVAFAVRFEDRVASGASWLCGPDQIVFLRGGTLARYNLKSKKEIWSHYLIDKREIERGVQATIKSLQALQAKRDQEFPDADPIHIPPPDKLAKAAERAAAAMMDLRIAGSNVWISTPGKLVRYDWDTGKPVKEVALTNAFGGLIPHGDEMLLFERRPEAEVVTHISLISGTTREEIVAKIERPPGASAADAATNRNATAGARMAKKGPDSGPAGSQGLDPARVEEQFSRMTIPQQIAAPAVLAVGRNQERALAEAEGTSGRRPAGPEFEPAEYFSLIPAPDGCFQFSSKLIEQRLVERQAMKAPPKKSALDGPVSVTATAEIANEILNEIQRDRGGSTVIEDESRYLVTVRRADRNCQDWQAEVVGSPALLPLKTVNVVTSNKKIIVLDKQNKKLWESALTYNVVGAERDEESAATGLGPCVERGDLLFVFDQGVLSAFDLKTGTAQWRVPSVGISGLFFDEAGMMYVNTTTAGPDSIKFSKQIDVTSRTSGLILKIDPRSGKTLWSRETRGGIQYLSGKFIYALEAYQAEEDEDGEKPTLSLGLETESFVRIRRINPGNGKDLWAHFQPRCPLDIKFNRNTIHLVFKKEVQVLRYTSL